MCNLYHHKVSMADTARTLGSIGLQLSERSRGLNLEPGYCGADQDGPVFVSDGKTVDVRTMRWGFPGIDRGDGKRATPITNIRNLNSSWWKNVNGPYLREPEYRCLVPFDRFGEWDKASKGNAWFKTIGDSPSFFAGLWRPWTGERLKPVEGKTRRQRQIDAWSLFAFLTTEPNAIVAPVHPKAMPVILTEPKECAEWLSGGLDSLHLQRPYTASAMTMSESR